MTDQPQVPQLPEYTGANMFLDRDRSKPLIKMLASRLVPRPRHSIAIPQKVKIKHKKVKYW